MIINISLKHADEEENTINCCAEDLPKGVIARSENDEPTIITEQGVALVYISYYDSPLDIWSISGFGDIYAIQPKGTVFSITQS